MTHWNPVARRQVSQLHMAAGEEPVGGEDERVDPLPHKGGKGHVDLIARVLDQQLCGTVESSFYAAIFSF
jgi:hypothetical protein